MHGIAISLNVDVDRLESKFHDSSHAAAEGTVHTLPLAAVVFQLAVRDGLRGYQPFFML